MSATHSDAWVHHARQWGKVGHPLRPTAEDAAFARDAVVEWCGRNGGGATALVLGVTPELCRLTASGLERTVAVDRSAAMLATQWPGKTRSRDVPVCGDWRAMPFDGLGAGLALGDGSVNALPDVASYAIVAAELRRVMRRDGRIVLRGFVRPERAEAVADVVEALKRGEIANFHVLKWRLAMALTDRETGSLAVADVWHEVHARWPDPQALAARHEWPLDQVLTINAYRDVDTRYSFPPAADFHRFLTLAGFPRIRECRGGYALAERCPTFIADPA